MQLDPEAYADPHGRGLEDPARLVLEHELGTPQRSQHVHM
jgi:hypothetical protein